jgi:hypothetical protein
MEFIGLTPRISGSRLEKLEHRVLAQLISYQVDLPLP